jgi:hypothetical protein
MRSVEIKEDSPSCKSMEFSHLRHKLPLNCISSISDSSIIELIGRIVPDEWVHSVLHRQHGFIITTEEQSFK